LLVGITIFLEILATIGFLIYSTVGSPSDQWYLAMFVTFGFLQTFVHVLILFTIPLLIAADYRDEQDYHSLPLAG
jgi:hypothetical protein